MVELLGRDGFLDVDQVGQLHHLAVAAAHEDVGQVAGRAAVGILDLHDHVVLLRAALETGDVATAQHRLQGSADRGDVAADRGDLVAVQRYLQLRLVELEIAVGINQLRVLGDLRHQLLHGGAQFLPAAHTLHDEVDRLAESVLP